jgi:hypothetical protein
MRELPTDLEILDKIYKHNFDKYMQFNKSATCRETKYFVPIDIKEISNSLNVDPDIVFGRLYYHLEKKYGYRQEDGSLVPFFAPHVGQDNHCINFPYLASVLASLRSENMKYVFATAVAVVSLIVSLISIAVSVTTK